MDFSITGLLLPASNACAKNLDCIISKIKTGQKFHKLSVQNKEHSEYFSDHISTFSV